MDGVEVFTGDEFTYEHYDFNFLNPSLQNFDVRQAFALCVPRQQIVDNLIIPLNPNAEVLNNRWFQSFEAGYTDTSGGLYDEVDIEEATALLEGSGVPLPLQVRVGYRTPNQRRTDQVALLKASCDQVGFEIIDAGVDTFFEIELNRGQLRRRHVRLDRRPQQDRGRRAPTRPAVATTTASTRNPEVDELIAQINRATELGRGQRAGHPARHPAVGGPGHHPGVHVPRPRGPHDRDRRASSSTRRSPG